MYYAESMPTRQRKTRISHHKQPATPATPPTPLLCNYQDCTHGPFKNNMGLTAHLRWHQLRGDTAIGAGAGGGTGGRTANGGTGTGTARVQTALGSIRELYRNPGESITIVSALVADYTGDLTLLNDILAGLRKAASMETAVAGGPNLQQQARTAAGQ